MGNIKVRGNAKLAFCVMGAVAVMAQHSTARAEDTEKLDRVEVTGSNIKRTTTETAAPVDIINAKDIQQSGKATIADVIHALPSDNNGSVPASFGNGFAHGAQGVSLRGLSVNSTLVLLNGRRLATYGLGDDGQRAFVDLNQIPLSLVDRIDIEKAGASAVYGSDAIAGVVNIKLKKEFVGTAFDASYGQSYLGDGGESHASATFGKGSLASDGYNAFLNIEGTLQNQIQTNGRPGYIGTDDLTSLGFGDLRPGNPTADIPTSSRSLTGNVLDLGTGQYYALKSNCANPDPGGFCRWDAKKGYTQIQPDTRRLNLFGRGTLRITDTTDAWLEASLFSTETKSLSTPTPTGGSLFNQSTLKGVSQEVVVRSTDPGYNKLLAAALPFTDGSLPTPGDPLRLRIRLGDVGPTTSDDKSTTTRVVLGFTGSSSGFDWDAAAGSIQSHLDSTLGGYVNFPAFNAAVKSGAYLPGADNSAVIPTFSKPLSTKATTKVNFIDAHGSTEVGELPGGKIGVAAGAEFRREEVNSPAVPGTFDASTMGLGYAAAQGSRSVSAFYAEALLPIVKQLEVEAAVRTDHYSDSGNTTNPQLHIKYTPWRELALRGTYARAFRAPSAYENGNSAAVGFVPSVVDPKLCPIEQAAKAANVPGVSSTPDCSFSAGVATVGNPAIKPETANSYTLGFVLEPSENYNASFDYYKIVRKNEIVQGDPAQLLPAYYAANGNLAGVNVIRDTVPGSAVVSALNAAGLNPNGYNPILLVSTGYVNATKTETSGFDIDFRARFKPADLGTFTTALSLTHIIKFRRTFADGSTIDYAGNAGPNQLSSGAGTPNWRAKAVLNWDRDPYGLTAVVSYRGPFMNTDGNQPTGTCADVQDVGGGTPGCYTASFTTIDLNGYYKIAKGWEINGGIRNLTNREAPYSPLPYAVTNTAATYDASGLIGRFFSVGMRYSM